MRKLLTQLGAGLGLIFAVGGPSTALAYPPQCMDIYVCDCLTPCDSPCYQGTHRTTCGNAYELCEDNCRGSDTQASVSQEQQSQAQQDAEQDVCTEQAPAAES
ncbi:hypothetical protein JY651_11490 [Pyxidicoccus parkwayensis]|uniref:Kazal-like domain-containing protein n=1 Tax=Pyxidicoccus parkwayensis TaxID=2813578 RepID=A0ABX7P4U4_9BACT|nr:hypothetical protein [Pyxidicoccus parkwaysis]QSQ25509.1 hypothetical protein JY651_11490 [Pyxidicoccus parkwaysis]